MRILDDSIDPRELARRCGSPSQFFGVQASVLSDGVERGIRALEFRTGTGFRFTVLVDRALDIGSAEFRGVPLGWHSPTGFRHPGLHEYNDERGASWLRSFSGLMVTAGLDHTLLMGSDTGEHYNYPARDILDFTLHGRVSNIPARLHGYGELWRDGDCVLWCEGTVAQAAVFGENLHLIRRIEARVGESSLTIHDRVVNRGFYRTPHMFLYHVNLGYPLLDEGSEYIAPIIETVWASHADHIDYQGVGYRTQSGPRANFREQVYQHRLAANADGKFITALVNRRFAGGRGIGFAMQVDKREFPYHFQWQNYQEGLYAMAMEPSTNQVLGRAFAKERGELIWLEHGEERSYTTTMSVLEDNEQIAALEASLAELAPTRQPEYPKPTGNWGG